ncbi:Tat binding protein 1-interacting [Alternaria rosae]|uniref:Tat binding protein 1-interacting n=1 Tax=Alternaria rosae TaxID=1187941 RepID=UPI001E8ED9A5|nr:Tat binding protein 1-interacting [Alternaria rosae]KAH6873084.1 Tat binding protein 1-interacting [Alternaria rosae]
MAPRKKTEEKATANEAADLVLEYLRKQNRPYSAIDVSANLHNKVTKASAAKILKDLHEQKAIEGRAAGKQIVYHALQNAAEACTTEQLAALDETILDLRTQTTTLVAVAKNLRSSLSSLNSTLSTADLIANAHTIETEKEQIEARIDGLKKGKAKKVTTSEREAIEKEWKKSIRVARRREKIAKEMWEKIEENLNDPQEIEKHREMFDLDE